MLSFSSPSTSCSICLSSMGSFASKSGDGWCCWTTMRKVLRAATATRRRRGHGAAAVHPWAPPTTEAPPPGQRVTVRMRASEFRALAAVRAAGDGGGDVARFILDGCAAGRWAWSPAPE